MTFVKHPSTALGQTRYDHGYVAPLWDDPSKMQAAVDAYFADCAERDEPATVTGLALALGFTNRGSLLKYEYGETATTLPEYVRRGLADTVKRAKLRIESQCEGRLLAGRVNPVGNIFALKNNFGWIDKVEHENNNNFTVQLVQFSPEQLASNVMDRQVIDVQPVSQSLPSVAQGAEIEVDVRTLGNSTK